MDSQRLAHIDQVVAEGLAKRQMAGCVVVVGHRGNSVWLKAYGHKQVKPAKVPMTVDTVFDMASITKPVATATSIMALVEQGQLRIAERVSTYVPEFAAEGKKDITLFQLLTHQGGLIPDNSLASGILGVATVARGSKSHRYVSIASSRSNLAPDDETMTGSTTSVFQS